MSQERTLKKLKKANKSKRETYAKKAGYDSVQEYMDFLTGTVTETIQYSNDIQKDLKPKALTAYDKEGVLMDIKEFCAYHGLNKDELRSWKLVTHTGVPYYNIAFYENVVETVVTEEEFKDLIKKGLDIPRERLSYNSLSNLEGKTGVGVVKIADLHLGAYIDSLIRTKDFSIGILAERLRKAAFQINRRNYAAVHVHILGDLIESFTGLSHKNTWKGLDKAMVGAEAVKLTVQILHKDFLNLIDNLVDVKLVAGNHDRVTSDNKEDVQGDAANLVGWGLELMGYQVEFNPLVITHRIGNITHILTHGHHGISKKSTQQLCWDYGEQGTFNLICEGHLHSIFDSLPIRSRDNFKTIKDDSVDHRRMVCPSFFTGNFYSEALGYTSQSGFVITEDNGDGVPNVFYYAV